MWGSRSIRSALFIDAENVVLPPDAIADWLAWLEEGEFDGRKPRRFLVKRIYWNSSTEKYRERYEALGFEVILCEKFPTLKNGADIRMAMDIVEATHRNRRIDEFILATTDFDFVPVLQRLDEKRKRTVILVDESRPGTHTTYRQHADILIPVRKLIEARKYTRPKPGLLGGYWGGRGSALPKNTASSPPDTRPPPPPPPEPVPTAEEILQQAVDRVIKVTSPKPQQYTSQRAIITELGKIRGFSKAAGPAGYFGAGSYKALMKELARRDSRIKVVDEPHDGTGVQYVPPREGDATPASTPPAAPAEIATSGSAAPKPKTKRHWFLNRMMSSRR